MQVVEGGLKNRENFSTENLWVDDYFSEDQKMYMTGEENKGNKIEYFYRAYKISKYNEQKLLIGLFQPENATYEELESLFPENKSYFDGIAYMPLEVDMIIALTHANVSSSEISKIIRIAYWSGKYIYENDNVTWLIMSGFPEGRPGVIGMDREDIKKYREEHKNSRN